MRQQSGVRNSADRVAARRAVKGTGSYSEEGKGGYRVCCALDDEDIVDAVMGSIKLAVGDPAMEAVQSSVDGRILNIAKTPAHAELVGVCSKPVLGIVEFDSDRDEAGDAILFRDASPRSFIADLTTETAYAVDLAQVLVRRLEEAAGVSGDLRSAILIALHEGIANALLHGNLEIGSLSNAVDLDTIVEFLTEVEDRLSYDELAKRRIRIAAEWSDQRIAVCISDEGRGFDHRSVMQFRRDSRHSPRGVGLIDQLADRIEYDDFGRVLCIEFALNKGAA